MKRFIENFIKNLMGVTFVAIVVPFCVFLIIVIPIMLVNFTNNYLWLILSLVIAAFITTIADYV